MIGLGLVAIPQKLLAEAVGLVVEVALVAGITWHYAGQHYAAKDAAQKVAQAQAVAAAASAAESETMRRVVAQQEIARDAQTAALQARADAGRADSAAAALRVQLDAYLSGRRASAGDSAAAPGSAAADDTARVLADLLRRADDRAGILAAAADAARDAGTACERAYGALTK